MCDLGSRVFLEVVRRESVVLGADERLEEPPGASCDRSEKPLVRRREELGLERRRRDADPASDRRREDPEGRQGQLEPEDVRLPHPRDGGRASAESDASHHPAEEPGEIPVEADVGSSGGHPLEEVLPGDVETGEGARDRVSHEPRLGSEQDEREGALEDGDREVRSGAAQEASLGDPAAPRDERVEDGQDVRTEDRGGDEPDPQERPLGRQGERRGERQERGRCDERAPEVVDHLPATDRRYGVPARESVLGGAAPEDPREELPVAARPPVAARRSHHEACRELVEDLYVRDEARAREDSLEEVVREEGVLRRLAAQRLLESVYVIDPLTGVAALAEEVLIDIGHGERIRLHPARAGEDPLVEGPLPHHWEEGLHARLKDRISLDDPALLAIVDRAVERVRDRADELRGRSSRQARVGVERDHEADVRRDRRLSSGFIDERRVRGAPEETVQLMELAALSLPAHPRPLGRIPDTPSVEEQEPRPTVGGGGVSPVELGDPDDRGVPNGIVGGRLFRRRVREVRDEGEANVAVSVRQEVHLELLDLLGDVGHAREESRHGDEGSHALGHAVLESERG